MSGDRLRLFAGFTLTVCAILCIVSNVLLFFPGWSEEAAQDPKHKLTPEVSMLVGIIGGGIMVLIPAIASLASRKSGRCRTRFEMLLFMLTASIGLCGSLFCLVMSVVAVTRGPVCQYYAPLETDITPAPTANYSLVWGRPFDKPMPQYNNESYIYHKESWDICVAPPGVVRFNLIFFFILVAEGSWEALICAALLVYALYRVITGSRNEGGFGYRDMNEAVKY